MTNYIKQLEERNEHLANQCSLWIPSWIKYSDEAYVYESSLCVYARAVCSMGYKGTGYWTARIYSGGQIHSTPKGFLTLEEVQEWVHNAIFINKICRRE